MRNKPIINGIDVSECEFFKQNRGFDCYKGRNCTETNDCYFKQCKRLEQREKALTEIADDLQKRNHDLTLTNERLEQENKELKARFNELYNNSKQLANKYNKYGGNKENELVEIINKTADEKNKYKQALEEIKTFAKPIKENTCFGMYCGFVDWTLEQCNEVLNDRD